MTWAGAALLGISCRDTHGSSAASVPRVPVVELTRTSVDVPHTYIADIKAVQFVDVKPMVEGYIREILVDEGQRVRKGQALFRLDAGLFAHAEAEAEANLRQAEAGLRMAQYEADRIGRMVRKGIMSAIRLEQAAAEQDAARMRVEQAGALLEQARTNVGYTTIRAPFDGYVDRIRNKVGSLVTPESHLTSVSDISEVFAYYRVNEAEYLRYRRALLRGEAHAESGELELLLPDGTVYPYKGRMEASESDFERITGSIAFRVRFPNPEGLLRHGVTGHLRTRVHMDSVLLVPQKSTFEIQEFTYVYAVDKEGKVRTRSFRPLDRYGKYYLATDLEPGMRIVYEGTQSVREGMRVEPEPVTQTSVPEPDTLKHATI